MVNIKNFKFIIMLKNIFVSLILFLALFFYFTSIWIDKTYEGMTLNEILFHIISPIKGTEKTILNNFLKQSLIPTIFLFIILIHIFDMLNKNLIRNKNLILGIEKFNFFNILKIFERKKEYILNLKILKKI